MSKIVLWTQEDCPLCSQVKSACGNEGFEERPAQELISGDRPDDEAMAQLALQDFQLPLAMVDGRFVSVEDLLRRASDAA